jgi:FkbM family methyltransferase
VLGLIRDCIRQLLRKLGYDIHKIRIERDPFRDMQRSIGRERKPVIFDVGANVGETIESFRNVMPSAEIHAFEPSQETFRRLQERCSAMPNVFLNGVAMGAVRKTAEFVEYTDPTMSSFFEPGRDSWGVIKQRIQVKVNTVDEYCSERGIDDIDILKLDTQAFDLEVIKGAGRLLVDHRVHMIYMEIIFSELYQGQPRLDEIFRVLADWGFVLVRLYNFHYSNDLLGWADALFIDPQFRSNVSSAAASVALVQSGSRA